MNREDEVCLALQGLINGVDYETGEAYDFSDTVIDSLKAVSAMLECNERNQHTIDSIKSSEESEQTDNDWDIVSGTFKEIIQSIKSEYSNHLAIIQCGCFYEMYDDDDIKFFYDRFSYEPVNMKGTIHIGFPVNTEKVLADLRSMKKPFVLVSQLPEKDEKGKTLRAISEVYNG
jgi:hypothetical protein